MKNKSDRRKFIRSIGMSGLGTGLLPGTILSTIEKQNLSPDNENLAKN